MQQFSGVAAAYVAEEVRLGSALRDEREPNIVSPDSDVAQEPSVPVHRIERRVPFEQHAGAGRHEAEQGSARLASVAIRLELGRVDLHDTHPSSVREAERVTVRDMGNSDALNRRELRDIMGAPAPGGSRGQSRGKREAG